MYNLKNQKGIVGECMFKLTRKWLILTQYMGANNYLFRFERYYTDEQKEFLKLNWYSLDGVEIEYEKGGEKRVLYEIKTKNQYARDLGYKPKTTASTYKLYMQAQKLGFEVRLAIIFLKNDWEYDILIEDFNSQNIYIDKPKKCDKK